MASAHTTPKAQGAGAWLRDTGQAPPLSRPQLPRLGRESWREAEGWPLQLRVQGSPPDGAATGAPVGALGGYERAVPVQDLPTSGFETRGPQRPCPVQDHPTSGFKTRGPQRPCPSEWSSQAGHSTIHLTLEPAQAAGPRSLARPGPLSRHSWKPLGS